MTFELTPEILADIKRKAEATPSPVWHLENDKCIYDVAKFPIAHVTCDEDAKFIERADPGTVLALVEEIEFLRRDNLVKAQLLAEALLEKRK